MCHVHHTCCECLVDRVIRQLGSKVSALTSLSVIHLEGVWGLIGQYTVVQISVYTVCALRFFHRHMMLSLLWKENSYFHLKGIVHPINKTPHLCQTCMMHLSFFGWTIALRSCDQTCEVILCVFDRRFTAANIVCLSGFLGLKSSRGWRMAFCSHNICDVSALTALCVCLHSFLIVSSVCYLYSCRWESIQITFAPDAGNHGYLECLKGIYYAPFYKM